MASFLLHTFITKTGKGKSIQVFSRMCLRVHLVFVLSCLLSSSLSMPFLIYVWLLILSCLCRLPSSCVCLSCLALPSHFPCLPLACLSIALPLPCLRICLYFVLPRFCFAFAFPFTFALPFTLPCFPFDLHFPLPLPFPSP